ncbi:uncharacterized protein [Pyxicephalus adspersus]|uniref:uncharacterized protein n=1 Tax=Pyxicephalus adspersus TaxID=30357 RepID=UPI003B58E222
MDSFDILIKQLRAAAASQGKAWLQDRPPEHLSPEPFAGAQDHIGSPQRDPPNLQAGQNMVHAGQRLGRNPVRRRSSGEEAAAARERSPLSPGEARRGEASPEAGLSRSAGTRHRTTRREAVATRGRSPHAAEVWGSHGEASSEAGASHSVGPWLEHGTAGPVQGGATEAPWSGGARAVGTPGCNADAAQSPGIPQLEHSSSDEEDTEMAQEAIEYVDVVLPGVRPCLILIVGHSYVCWGDRKAEVWPEGEQLGLSTAEATVRWLGVPGMLWSRVMPEIRRLAASDRPPDVVVFHAGGDDMGLRAMRELIRDVKIDFLRLKTEFPGLVIGWSDIVARTNWRGARSVEKINKARIKVNKEVGRFVVRNGGIVIRHRELEEETRKYLCRDGVHLNAIGTDKWFLGLQDGVQRALCLWRGTQA